MLKIIEKIFLVGFILFSIFYIFDIFSYFNILLFREQYLSACLGMALPSVFFTTTIRGERYRENVPWYDVVMGILSLIISTYIFLFYPRIVCTFGKIELIRIIFGAIAIVLVMEASRRLLGWTLVIVIGFFIIYGRYASIFPSILHSDGVPWKRLLPFIYLDPNSLLGLPLHVVFGIVTPFILFGGFLFAMGAGNFLIDLSSALVGRFRGGPAMMAVVASGLFGSMSGSAVSDVVTTGSITIPMMKRLGYKAEFAGAVEAAASSGGPFLPPIMGTAAFLMAEFLSIPYADVALRALGPAIIYYLVVLLGVRLVTGKQRLKSLEKKDIVPLIPLLRTGWLYFLPAIVLIYFLFVLHFRPGKAAFLATIAVILVGFLQKRRISLWEFIEVLCRAGKALLPIVIVCCIAGFIVGSLAITGLGFSFSGILIQLCGENIYVLLILTALGCIIMGIGLPITAIYILLSILIVPALVDSGFNPLASHFFIIFYGILSFLTPPICLAVYSACSISGGDVMKTAFEAVRLSIAAYVIPFIFIFDISLLLIGSWADILLKYLSVMISLLILEVSLIGYLFFRLDKTERIMLFIGSSAIWVPLLQAPFRIAGFGIILLSCFLIFKRYRKYRLIGVA